MKRSFNHHGQRLAMVTTFAALTGILFITSVFAEQPPGGLGGGPGGFRGPGGPGGRRPGGPRPISVSMIPAKSLSSMLGLSPDQTAKIAVIQEAIQKERQKLMPAPGAQGDGPPDRETMQASREKMRILDQKATGDIEAVLTTEQKSALPDLLKILNALGRAGIPPEVAGDLKLTADQRRQLAALPGGPPPRPDEGGGPPPSRDGRGPGRREADEKVMAILTAEQKKIVEAYRKAHLRQGPGEGGGRPPRGGGFGPPPGGGDGAPPPPPPFDSLSIAP